MAKNKGRRKSGRQEQPEFQNGPLWAAVILAAVGLALAAYSTQLSFKIKTAGIVEASGCSINDFVNCDLAHSSSYGELMGIPVAWWGFLFYAFAGLSALWGTMAKDRRNAAGWITLSFILAIGSVLFSVLKGYHLVQLAVVCLVCIGMYAVNIGLLFTLPVGLGYGPSRWGALIKGWIAGIKGDENELKFEPNLKRWGLLAVLVFGIGWIGMKRQSESAQVVDPNWDVDLALTGHFRQTPIDVPIDPNAAVWGNPDADIKIVEFADFQCPACRESAFHLRTALFEYREDVALYYMNYPLDANFNPRMQSQLHAQAGPAAVAAVCAQAEGDAAFWEYHDELFRQQVQLGPALFESTAEDMGFDMEAFRACQADPATRARVVSDLEAGFNSTVSQTPTIFINGRKASNYRNTEFIRAVLDRELEG
ncbi:MAG: thioredoxin domain-containing protein [Rhodothermales bacterium]|nr:thioredoxin domain-containing protein [Rhodothermales bacterium]MBO6780972.1 thioredoxin domain-containing protein [Rhodothermales bacterium]